MGTSQRPARFPDGRPALGSRKADRTASARSIQARCDLRLEPLGDAVHRAGDTVELGHTDGVQGLRLLLGRAVCGGCLCPPPDAGGTRLAWSLGARDARGQPPAGAAPRRRAEMAGRRLLEQQLRPGCRAGSTAPRRPRDRGDSVQRADHTDRNPAPRPGSRAHPVRRSLGRAQGRGSGCPRAGQGRSRRQSAGDVDARRPRQ